jgi:hypothetical protein
MALVVLRVHIKFEHPVVVSEVPDSLDVAVDCEPMDRRISVHITMVETPAQPETRFKGFYISLPGGQMHVFIVGHEAAKTFPLPQLLVAHGTESLQFLD